MAAKKKGLDECRARGCGGWIPGLDTGDIGDGEIANCHQCRRQHTFHIYNDAAHVEVARAPRKVVAQ